MFQGLELFLSFCDILISCCKLHVLCSSLDIFSLVRTLQCSTMFPITLSFLIASFLLDFCKASRMFFDLLKSSLARFKIWSWSVIISRFKYLIGSSLPSFLQSNFMKFIICWNKISPCNRTIPDFVLGVIWK